MSRCSALTPSLATFALLAAIALPQSAFAQRATTVDCAVGWTGGTQYVVLTYGTYDSRAGLADAGSFCTQLISSNTFIGADRDKDWERAGYLRLCHVQLTGGEDLVVHAWSDYDSKVLGYTFCLSGDQGSVRYYEGTEMTSPSRTQPRGAGY